MDRTIAINSITIHLSWIYTVHQCGHTDHGIMTKRFWPKDKEKQRMTPMVAQKAVWGERERERGQIEIREF